MKSLQELYTFKSIGPPDYYFGNNFKKDSKERWNVGCKKYITEALARVEMMFEPDAKNDTPMVAEDHPECDDSKLLNDEEHTIYQMLIGILNWIITIGRLA